MGQQTAFNPKRTLLPEFIRALTRVLNTVQPPPCLKQLARTEASLDVTLESLCWLSFSSEARAGGDAGFSDYPAWGLGDCRTWLNKAPGKPGGRFYIQLAA